ncbi:hypothetical protein P0092_09285 [Ruminiclostridium papyrosolvens DSM 2782]|uniref:hypothetical protein n=1 Tax=Ruminiclostridium papyrosolvens TaxID=29362 RepID=UPI0002F6D3BD|nr:hypothetical protein [Ruminiclostridium papyrosolvens]WES36041.1 hypothetical protein P0092_08785 [Ruminiclostridium papyrosolvens DSM 2782]WES36139.1 hypothetical protein P0092_09285 [Ruminiclostridium papyrosolvens DSM 2782]
MYFRPFYDDEKVAELFKDEDGDWCYSSPVTDSTEEFVSDGNRCLHDVKIEVEDAIYKHYEDERNYYQDILDRFSE